MNATAFGEALSNSLSSSSILILAALGLAITFGVMRVINMAHGDMMMLGAYTAFVVTDPHWLPAFLNHIGAMIGFEWHISFNIFAAIPASFLVVGLIGYLLEISLIRFLYGRPLDTLLATWGVGLIFQQSVNLTFGADLKSMELPDMLQGTPEFLEGTAFAIPTLRLFIVAVTVFCLLAVYWWFFRTTSGLKIRAVVQNRPMASALGVSTRRVDSVTFAFASGLAGIAGCILAHLRTTKYTMGADYVVDAFMVVILGGMGQLAGAVGAGGVIGSGKGIIEKALSIFTSIDSPAGMAKFATLIIVVAFLLVRPSGLFTTKERSYE
jgi:urea transport system permease protein